MKIHALEVMYIPVSLETSCTSFSSTVQATFVPLGVETSIPVPARTFLSVPMHSMMK